MPEINSKSNTKKLKIRGTDEIEIGSSMGFKENGFAPHLQVDPQQTQKFKWLLKDWIPYGAITGVVGSPGAGKSAFVLYGIIRPVITGEKWFNGALGPKVPQNVLWCPTEGDAVLTAHRVAKWKLPHERIKLVFSDPDTRLDLNDSYHLEKLEEAINRSKTPLVVIDSLAAANTRNENDSRMSVLLKNIAKIAERTKAAIVVTHPSRKFLENRELTLEDCRGSNAITSFMKCTLGIDCPDRVTNWKRVRILKENLGINHPPFGFRVSDTGLEFGDAPGRLQAKKESSMAWLKKYLKPGIKYPSTQVLEDGVAEGFTQSRLRKSAAALKVEIRQVRDDHKVTGWTWTLP